MNSDCNKINPLQRSGANQYERVLQALLPSYARVDERDYADLILFAKKYAQQLNYFNSSNTVDGNWDAFMSMDVSVTLAYIMKLKVKSYFGYSKEIFDKIKIIDVSDEALLKNHFKILFDLGFSITAIINEYYNALPFDFEYRTSMGNAIQSHLQEYYYRLKRYYEEAISQNIIDPSSTFAIENANLSITLSQNFVEGNLSNLWIDSSLPIFTPTFNGATTSIKIKNTSTHNLFTGILDKYLKTLARIVEQASGFLDKTLSNFPTHAPHYGLYLTFLKLFRFSQDHLNTYTKRHLDLYYKEILKLKSKAPEPDKVHLTFELAKGVDNHLIKKETVFKAGKDADGVEIFYSLTEDLVINKGEVKKLSSVYVDKDISNGTRQVFASPIANSEDGKGGKLLSPDKSWKAFGDAARDTAPIGFAIASNYLYLTEGTRTITFNFYAPSGDSISFNTENITDLFTLQLSGKKGWIDIIIDPSNVIIHSTKEYFSITVTLDGGEQAVVPYLPKTHQYNFATNLPVAKFCIKNALAKEEVWNFHISKVGISISVTGMKKLAIQNDSGNLNSSKPFDLFGTSPHIGSSFILGSKELFLKTINPSGNVAVSVNFTWDDYFDLTGKISSDDKHKVDLYYLEDAAWKQVKSNLKLFQDNKPDFDFIPPQDMLEGIDSNAVLLPFLNTPESPIDNIGLSPSSSIEDISLTHIYLINGNSKLSVNLPAIDAEVDYTDNENYSVQSSWGFLKVELNTDFGHGSYAKRLADAAKDATITSVQSSSDPNKTTTTIKMDEVEEPYTPKVKEISLDYTASTIIDFSSDNNGSYLHVTPFGTKDLASSTNKSLLPEVNQEGELFIGIANFTTDQTLSILFQVSEGTADPLSEQQEITWSFLTKNNEWKNFDKEDIADSTNHLLQSGIIKFSISDEADSENTLFSENYHWIKATIKEKTPSICKLIEVIAQAGVAQFYDYKNTGNSFKTSLPANTISKMAMSDSAVKKISQPYSSFDGRTKEQDNHFYLRASERLRHKNRGISIWDYERLVLESFPSIFKVKCINHTQVLEKTVGTKTTYTDNELKPGSVLVVPIPDLQNKNAFDPLRPYTSLGLLTEIKHFLYKYISPHVNLDVRNPRFEEIQLEFKVKFINEDNEFYRKQLKVELEQLLAPWAFDPTTDFEFGGKISKSVLIDFIEERSYVDYLSCVKMYQIVEGERSADLDEAIATSSRSVFVSVKSSDETNAHKISFISDKCDC